MAKSKNKPSVQSVEAAEKMAKATQKPGQTKEQTKLIAQGIQKGIEQYKKQQKAKARDLDRRLKKARTTPSAELATTDVTSDDIEIARRNWLPWVLLILSWVGFIAFQLFSHKR